MEDRTIIIKVNQLELKIKIDSSQLADLVWERLPIEASANLWGDEIYFKTDLDNQANELQQSVELGDVAFGLLGKQYACFMDKHQ